MDLSSHLDPSTGVLRTHLTGTVDVDDVAEWVAGLRLAVASVPDGGTFRLLVDLHGYEPASLDAHRDMRLVVPELLAAHGMAPAVAGLFEDAEPVPVTVERGVRCTAMANVHHDPEKMTRYADTVGGPEQQFFHDPAAAEAWLLAAG